MKLDRCINVYKLKPKQFSDIHRFLSIGFKRPKLATDLLTGFGSCRLPLVSENHILEVCIMMLYLEKTDVEKVSPLDFFNFFGFSVLLINGLGLDV